MTRTAGEVAEAVGARTIGDGEIKIHGLASISNAKDSDLVFVEDEKYLDSALRCQASAIVAGAFAENTKTSKTLLISTFPRLAFARAAKLLVESSYREPGVHPNAIVLPSASVAQTATIDPWTFIGENASIGNHTWIGAHCVIGSGVVIGDECKVYPGVTVYPGTRIGNRVIVHAGAVLGSDGFGYVRDPKTGKQEKFPQVGDLIIEDDVEIGANSTIDRGALATTRIGCGTKLDNLVHIGHNCQIGENVVIAAQAGFSGSVHVEDNVVIAGQVGVAEHSRIQEGVILGGQTGVPSNKIVRGKGVVFWGTPARPIREYLKSLAMLARLARKE